MAKAKKEKQGKEREKKKRKPGPKKQSLARNVALLVLSVVILGGVSFLFTRLSARPEYSYEPIQKNLGKIARKARENAPAQSPQPAPEKGSTGTYDEVWNMLVPRGQESPGPERYVVQIAAFRTREDAARKEDELREKIRLDCDVEMRDGLYMLTYGSFRTRESAERTCSTLRSRLRQECVVMQY